MNSFTPMRALGAGIEGLRGGITDKVMTPEFIEQIQSAGWQAVSYRQNTELSAEAWHWNPKGKWSNPAAKAGYFVGDRRDLNTYWKSNPYLTKRFTGDDDHPQWVTLDLGSKMEINAIRIAWADPYPVQYRIQYWNRRSQPLRLTWRRDLRGFPLGSVSQ